jgi:dTDP-4-dehydrorhamnose 3,5-epimerase
MDVQQFKIKELRLIIPKRFGDPRGYFQETWSDRAYRDVLGEWRDPSEWTGLNCSSASFGWFFLLGFLAVLSIKSGQQTGVQTYP